MVLTRGCKSIARRLPNEALSEAMAHVPYVDLLSLSITSRLFNGLAIPLIYRTIRLTTVPGIENFLSALKYPNSPFPRSLHVREFSVISELTLPVAIVDAITAIAPLFSNLQSLKLLFNTHFPRLLRHAHFPDLRTFHYSMSQESGAVVSVFINRHPTITALVLLPGAEVNELDSCRLPHLTKFSGPGSLVRALICDNKSIEMTSIYWLPDDLDVETPLAKLRQMVSPNIHGLIANTNVVHEPEIFRSLAVNLPQISFLVFQKITAVAGRMCLMHAFAIAEHLRGLKNLLVLEFRGFETDDVKVPEYLAVDCAIVRLWSESCPALCQIFLHGNRWDYKGTTGWEIHGKTSV
ncbi:hypothetical protein B0H11DRAFT_1070166 [Mycena galericulata]|nr:hypothetical protein B0H11DRAFT_1070166 [Mycena galericulata]